MVVNKNKPEDEINRLFEGLLKPLHSKNARLIFNIFYSNRNFEYLTTYDLEQKLKENNQSFSKKEINAWLVSLCDAGLVIKMRERGKPVISTYENRYTFDLWRLSDEGFNVGYKLSVLMIRGEKKAMPQLKELTQKKINEIEDLYFTSKILLLLHDHGGNLSYSELRKQLGINREKLAIYSWPDISHSEKLLFELKIKPPTLRTKVLKLFGLVQEQDLIFTLTEEGKNMALIILSQKNDS